MILVVRISHQNYGIRDDILRFANILDIFHDRKAGHSIRLSKRKDLQNRLSFERHDKNTSNAQGG